MKKAIVLCGTRPHIELIKELKSMGYYTILVDFAKNPIAKKYSDKHYMENAFDKSIVLEIARKEKVSLVISVAADQAYVVSAYVMEMMNLYTPISYKDAQRIANKLHMKKRMINSNINTSRYYEIADNDGLNQLKNLKYPIIFKPSDGYGSKGIRKTESTSELSKNFDIAKNASRNGKVLVEEFIKGKEYNLYAIVQDYNVEVISIAEKFPFSTTHSDSVFQSSGLVFFPSFTDLITSAVIIQLEKITKTFNIKNSFLLVQFILDENGNISIIEFAPRLGGGLSYKLVKTISNINPVKVCINFFLNEKNYSKLGEKDNYYMILHVFAQKCTFKELFNYKSLIKNDFVHEIFIDKKDGDLILGTMSSSDRVAQVVIKDTTRSRLISKAKAVIELLEIIDIYGNSNLMIKDIYSNILNQ